MIRSAAEKYRLAIIATHPVPYYVPLYRALAKQGELEVCAFFASRVGLEEMIDPGMGVSIVWKADVLGGYRSEFLPGADSVRSTRFADVDNPGVGAFLAGFDPDVVLIHGYMWRTAIRGLAWARHFRVPAIMISDVSLHSGTGAVKRRVKDILLPFVFRQYEAFFCIGDANERYLRQYGVPPERIFRVPIIVDEVFWQHRARRAEIRQSMRAKMGLAEGDLVVLFVGKLIARKRPGDLLEALRKIGARSPTKKRVRVIFTGDGEQRAELESLAREASLPAEFPGFVNIDLLPAYYCAADVLAHPAEIETFGVIALEAAVLGLPLVLSNRVGAIGPTSIAQPGKNTLVHACGDTEVLAEALWQIASDPELERRLSAASLEISEELGYRKSVAGALEAVRYCVDGTTGRRRSLEHRPS